MKLTEWINFFNRLSPPSFAWKSDNVGKQMGNMNKQIKHIMICLECNETVVNKSIAQNIDLIITFHPFFWPNRRKNLEIPDKKNLYLKLKKHKIAVFSMHTNYENLFLSHFLLKKIVDSKVESSDLISYAYYQPTVKLKSIIQKCKKLFGISHVDYWIKGDLDQKIRKIVLISGSGGYGLDAIQDIGADLLITGDLKWNHWQTILQRQQNTIVVGHHMEEYFVQSLSKQILKSPYGVTCRLFNHYQGSIFKKI